MMRPRVLSEEFTARHPGIGLDWVVPGEGELRQAVSVDIALGRRRFDLLTLGTHEVPIWDDIRRVSTASACAADPAGARTWRSSPPWPTRWARIGSTRAGARGSTRPNGGRRSTSISASWRSLTLRSVRSADRMDPAVGPVPYAGVRFVAITEFQGSGPAVGREFARALTGERTAGEALAAPQEIVLQEMTAAGYHRG